MIRMEMSGLIYRFWDGIDRTIVNVYYRGRTAMYEIPFSKIVWC